MRFVDTNVLPHAVSRDPAEQGKARRANEILDQGGLALSVQVLQEFYVQATRAGRADALTHEQAQGLVESWCRFPVRGTTTQLVLAAMVTRARFRISYWEAAIIEAGRSLGCAVILSEDLDAATDFGGVRVENPFVTT